MLYIESADRLFGGLRLDRLKAVNILKALDHKDLGEPSFISIAKDDCGFYIILRGVRVSDTIRVFLADKGLIFYENKEEDYCIIYEPLCDHCWLSQKVIKCT